MDCQTENYQEELIKSIKEKLNEQTISEDIKLIFCWLKKLEDTKKHPNQKETGIEYLEYLDYLLDGEKIHFPFIVRPPKGCLPPLRKILLEAFEWNNNGESEDELLTDQTDLSESKIIMENTNEKIFKDRDQFKDAVRSCEVSNSLPSLRKARVLPDSCEQPNKQLSKSQDLYLSLNESILPSEPFHIDNNGTNSLTPENLLCDLVNSVTKDTTLYEFIYKVSSHTSDDGRVMLDVIRDEMAQFRDHVRQSFESRTSQISNTMASKQIILMKKFKFIERSYKIKINKVLTRIMGYYPNFNYDLYKKDSSYLQSFVDSKLAEKSH